MRSFVRNSVLALSVASVLGFSSLFSQQIEAVTCVNNFSPSSFSQLLRTNADGSKDYVLYKWDNDSPGQYGAMALYNSAGTVLQYSTTGYLNVHQPKGAGYWHLDVTDVNSCGAYVRWVRALVIYN